MHKLIPPGIFILFISTVLFSIVSCNKELSSVNNTGSSGSPATTSTSSTIAVAADSTGLDSVYIIQRCVNGFFRDSIAASALPDSVQAYLTTNYAGFHFAMGFVIKDSAGTVGGYVVIISFNGKPVGLLFDASGNFKQVLEQRERGDINGAGWHHGGRFGNRDGSQRDSVALSALPVAITSYMSSNFPSDTLIRAYQNRDSSMLVISKNNGIFADLFTSSGIFIKRVPLTPQGILFKHPAEIIQHVVQDSLPVSDLGYLTNTFPNYTFETALSVSGNGQLLGYVVVVDADNTKYAIWFDISGNVIAALPIW